MRLFGEDRAYCRINKDGVFQGDRSRLQALEEGLDILGYLV